MDKINNQEIDILIEAVDEWVNKDSMGNLMTGLMGTLFTDKMDEVGKKKFEEMEAKKDRERKEARKLREETAIMLKAKLLSMKQRIAINQLETMS
jgi:hypothetical protein